MQRQLSNVSVYSYQDYQPSRKYGQQYEPGGYAAAVQQRTNMTQREDALKFEQGRIKALQEERLHIQKKTFTKWINSFLQKARMEVDDLFVDLADGRRLLKLLEIISGERLPRANNGRMRVHKIENVNKSLSFLHTKVRLESIGAEDIVDGNPRLILGLIWTIILRFQIQEIEIDVDEENVSSEKKSAKDALLLWCQRKTSGYHGVHIHNFTDSWRSGLGFNALIHAHRPDLFRWSELPVTEHVETLNHAFDVAHKHLGIPRLLDAEDVDTSRPDEKSVMTYVASYYHTFARMKNEQKSGKRIANIIGQMMDCDDRKGEYSKLFSVLLEWILLKIQELNGREFPNSLDGIQRLLLSFKQYRTVEKPPKYKERSEIEALYFDINTMQKSLTGEAWAPLEGQLPQDLERAWQQLEQAEHAREIALRTELLRQQRLEQLNYKFNTKSVLRKGYLKEMIQVLSDPRYGSNLAQVDATVKKHEAISADILARTERFEDLSAMAAELVREKYHGAEAVSRTEQAVLTRWNELLELLERHRSSLGKLAHLMALLREADTVGHTLTEMKAQFQSEEVGRHLVDVERLLQAHALQELQLGALDESIRRLVRHGAQADGAEGPKQQLTTQLNQLSQDYDSLVAAAKDRKARLEDARNLYQFLEDHDEEEGWVTEKQRICRTDVAAKELRAVLALRQKHTALLHELRARDHVSQRHRAKGQSLIDAKHPKSAEIERRLTSLNKQWQVLRELAAAREKQLADAAEAHQFYGDANESESWMKEKRPLVATDDCGRDAPSAGALLARHRATHEEIKAYSAELDTLSASAARLNAAGITCLQLPTEVESTPAIEEEEWVNESRLVPTEVWEEEPVERLEHRTVTEERSVPQVKALYAFTGQGISMAKGEVMFLINKTNPDWWSVRKADRTDGFVPANYVREIEPRVVPVQVRRPEKVRTVQRVKKTVLVKQVVPVKRSKPSQAARRASRTTMPQQKTASVETRMAEIQKDYDELLTLSAARRAQLEDAIKLYSFFAECDDFDKWIKDKEKMLRADDPDDSVENAKRKYEKFVTDLSAASRRLEHIDAAAEELVAAKHGQAAKATARRQQLRQQWDRLLRLKQQKEKSLEGASSVELFSRTCDEALDWMAEKENQLAASSAPAADLRTVRALQRRHAQLERELEPVREKVNTISLLADSVKSQYPNERGNVEGRQKEIQQMWERCQAQAAERRSRLESAVGHQIFGRSSSTLTHWMQKVREQLAQEATAKDVATAEALHKQHQELMDDIKAHDDEYKEVIALGKQLLANNPALTDVADKIKSLETDHQAVVKEWQDKDAYLKQLVQLQSFNRECDQIDASSGAHEAYLEYKQFGSSVDEAEALVKRHEELEARLAAQDERLAAFVQRAEALEKIPHYAAEHIAARRAAVLQRRDGVRHAAAERRRALLASLAHQQFVAATEELQNWIQDKTRTAKDQSYRDLANLERKLQKHEAFERELQANEKQLRNVESIGHSLQKSDPSRSAEVSQHLSGLQTAWEELVAASRDKGSKLRQAAQQRKHRRSVEDAKARLIDLERQLKSEEIGTDLRSCKRLLNQHQALEQELSLWETKATSLADQGADLVSGGHFDAAAIERDSAALLQAVRALQPPAAKRRQALESSLQLHKFAAEVAGELDWLSERSAAAASEVMPTDLHAAQSAQKKHGKLKAELVGRRPLIERVIAHGNSLVEEGHPQKKKIEALCAELEAGYTSVSEAADSRGAALEAALKAQQFMHDALEVDAWLNDKAAALAHADLARDRHRATHLLTRHKAVELELDTYAAIIAEMGHVATSMANGGHPEGEALLARHALLVDSLARLQRLAAQRQKALVESVCRHEYLAESAELESWIQEQYAAASSEDYGQDYEHLLILRSKFDELRHRVESGAERFNQCEELAKKLLATESPYIGDIEKRQEALGEWWQRLVEQMESRASRLHAAGEIHRFHRDVAELAERAHDARAALHAPPPPRDLRAATAASRALHTQQNDLLAIDAQMQVLQEEGNRLQKLYPGGNVQQIELQQKALEEAWTMLKQASEERKHTLQQYLQLYQFLTEVRDLTSWSVALRTSMSRALRVRDAVSAQAARAEHDAVRAELDARDSSFRNALQMGRELTAHPNAQEVEEKCEALLEERNRLHGAWAARQVALDQLIDLHCFLRDAKLLHELCATQEAALSEYNRLHGAWAARQVALDQLIDLHCFLRDAKLLHELCATQEAALSEYNRLHGAWAARQVALDQLIDLHCFLRDAKLLHELCATQEAALSEYNRLHGAWAARQVALDQLIDLHCFLRDAKLLHELCATQEAALSEYNRLHGAWAARQVALDQLIDLHCFLRDAKLLHELCATQEAALSEYNRLHGAWAARQVALDQLIDLHCFLRDAKLLHELCATQEAALSEYNRLHGAWAARQVALDQLIDLHCFLRDAKLLHELCATQEAALSEYNRLHGAWAARQVALDQLIDLHCFLRDAKLLHELCATQEAALSEYNRLHGAWAARQVALDQLIDLHCFLRDAKLLHELCATQEAALSEYNRLHGAWAARQVALDQLIDLHCFLRDAKLLHELCATQEAALSEYNRLHGAWAARQVALDQLIDLHCFLRDAKLLHELCATQEAALSTEISQTSSVEEVENALKKHEAFEKLLATQDEKLATLNSHGDKLLQQNHVESQRIADELQHINERRKKLYEAAAARRSALVRSRARAQFARDAAEARGWVADKLAKLAAEHQHGEVTNLEDKIKKLQKHQAFTAELAANRARLQEVQELATQLSPDAEVDKQLQQLQSDWQRLETATEQRGRGLEEAQDILEFNQHLDKIEAWIRDKEMMVQAHELGRDYEHCSALLRKLDDVDSDMKVDDKRVKSICALADKLLQQGPTQQAAAVSQRRDAFLAKWRALSGALHKYRENLCAAAEIHSFNRDVEDTAERISKKAALFSSSERGRELTAAHELKRKHLARAAEAGAIRDKIQQLEGEGTTLTKKYPERAKEIETSLQSLREGWEQLQELAAKRTALLDEAIAEHKFDENLKELELWVSEAVKRMDETGAPETVPDAEALLELHHEKKAEIDGRQKVIVSLQKEVEQVPEKMKRVEVLSSTLDQAWLKRKQYLTQAHQLQLLKEQARQTEDWLASKEAFLNNDDLGENLDAVETLIRKHAEFSKLLHSQLNRVDELQRFAHSMLEEQHFDREYVEMRLKTILNRRDKLQESCKQRGETLEQSRQLHQFLRNLYHEREWISLKMQIANDQNYRELSNLQSKIQKHAAFESELAANKGRIDDVANHGETLIEAKHYAAQEIAKHVEELEYQWRELQAAAKLRRERLQEAYQARVYLRGLDDFTAWLDDVEAQLLSEDHGKDLASVTALLKRHSRLEQQVSSKAELATQLGDNARQLADSAHFMAQEILSKADAAVARYRQLQEPMQIRRDNLEDAALLHRWDRDADEEFRWLSEREAAVRQEEAGSTLAEAQAMLKKHLALEAELLAREPIIKALLTRAGQLSRRGHFAGAALESRARDLAAAHRALLDAAANRTALIKDRCALLQLLSEISEAEAWLLERRIVLVSGDVGRDEDSTLTLVRRLDALQREVTGFDSSVVKLEKAAATLMERPTIDGEQLQKRIDEIKATYEDMKLLSAKRQQRLQQSLKYFKFVQECEEVQEWISEQMTTAASEEYGLDVEHVETLQQAFDNFLAQLQANEGRIEGVCEAGHVLLEENTPEADRVKQRIDDIKGLWDDLKELALARQEALAGARQVHEFDRSAEETGAWVGEKESALASEAAPPRTLHELHAHSRALHALRADLDAIRAAHDKLQVEAERLGTAFPDAKEHVSAKLEDVTEALQTLVRRADQCSHQLELAAQLQAYFDTYQELLAWTNETLARVTAPDLAHDVSGAERLLARHQDIKVEIEAKEEAFHTLYNDGEKLVKEGHFMSNEIEERMSLLRSRRAHLDGAWSNRDRIYTQHLDALVFKRDADALDNWITNRVPLVRDGKYGESVAQVEELINRHRDLEETIDAQRDKFNALKRITLVEQAFQTQRDEEEQARRISAERQEAERLQQYRRREMERITEERRRETAPVPMTRESERLQTSVAAASSEEALSPAPQFERLPKNEQLVKRAESMSVVKTPKRTPSFTTRRRTQSFRRHRRGDIAELPPVEIEGYLERKQEAGCGGKRATVRSWRAYYSVLCGQLLCFFRDELDFASAKAAAPPVAILNARCEPAGDYTKRANVFRLACADGAEYLFACSSKDLMKDWVAKLSFHAQLPPELQLTPYSAVPPGESPTAEIRRRLQENAESSSSAGSSPEPERRPRTQAEILQEHRNSQQSQRVSSTTPERVIESTVLPSLPPRQPPQEEDATEVVLRSQEQIAGSTTWGRSRFSNGRDINSEFIRSQQNADIGAPPLPLSGPPDRPPIPERAPNLAERAPSLPDRGPSLPDRGPNLPERNPNQERTNAQGEKQSVSALVNSYQQRMSGGNWQTREGRDGNANRNTTSWQGYSTGPNNNWQSVETTSHFYSTSETAYGGSSGGNTRPASVAGSGGSPALDQRPASRSSGESELSVSGVTKDKKDKKGVFGGLFSRKKRPQSHM